MTILDTAYRCPACQADRGNTPRDLPCPNCELTLDEAQEKVAGKPESEAQKPLPDWLERQYRLVPLVAEHDHVAEELAKALEEFGRRCHADPRDPELDLLSEKIRGLSTAKTRHFLGLIGAGMKFGELPKLRRQTAEGRLPIH